MNMSLPSLTGVGRLTADPELKFTQSGIAMARLNLAFNSRKKNQQTGEWEDGDTLYMTATCWRDQAEAAAEHLVKGTEVVVSGRPRTESWETKDGQKRSAVVLLVDSIAPTVRALEKKSERSNGNRKQSREPSRAFSDDPPF